MGDDDLHDIELTGYGARLARYTLETWDVSRVALVLRSGGPVPQEVRDLLADMIEGKVRRGKGRVRSVDYRSEAVHSYAEFVRSLRAGNKRDFALDHAAGARGKSRRTVIEHVKFVESGGAPFEKLGIDSEVWY